MSQALEELGEPSYRSRQVMEWIWGSGIRDFQLMTNVSKSIRGKLEDKFHVAWPQLKRSFQAEDGTIKFLLGLSDGKLMESVLIPSQDHYTICVSTQVGCPMGCTFCSTGRMGFERNLSSGEIAGQVLSAREYLNRTNDPLPVRNMVIMGMGEPLLNWPRVKKALEIIRHPHALNFSRRKVTLSTVGIPGRLDDLSQSGLALPAVSLHAPDQSLRKTLMPAASKYELSSLIADLERYPLAPRERITVEYVMLGGINDSLEHARKLVRILSRVKCKINLLNYNPGQDPVFEPSPQLNVEIFQNFLRSRGFTVMLRKSMGADIHAACGQLKADFTA